jgi:H+-translocating NAD(P) transhydrogenase subunit beta
MPVVIALLNSYSGLAACAAGFIIGNTVLIVAGCLVGASGLILTRIMCKAMNRSLANVLFSGFGATQAAAAGDGVQARPSRSPPRTPTTVLESARSVVSSPATAWPLPRPSTPSASWRDLLEANGCEVRYAIHPVAGRMPAT